MTKRRYKVVKDFAHPDRSQGICRAGGEVELTARQARYLLLSGHLAHLPDPVPAAADTTEETQSPAVSATEAQPRRKR